MTDDANLLLPLLLRQGFLPSFFSDPSLLPSRVNPPPPPPPSCKKWAQKTLAQPKNRRNRAGMKNGSRYQMGCEVGRGEGKGGGSE